jgi:hypothetical protein
MTSARGLPACSPAPMDSAEDDDDGRRHTARRPRYSLKHDDGAVEATRADDVDGPGQIASVFITLRHPTTVLRLPACSLAPFHSRSAEDDGGGHRHTVRRPCYSRRTRRCRCGSFQRTARHGLRSRDGQRQDDINGLPFSPTERGTQGNGGYASVVGIQPGRRGTPAVPNATTAPKMRTVELAAAARHCFDRG